MSVLFLLQYLKRFNKIVAKIQKHPVTKMNLLLLKLHQPLRVAWKIQLTNVLSLEEVGKEEGEEKSLVKVLEKF